MKKVLTILLVIATVLATTVGAIAATTETSLNGYTKDSVIEMVAGDTYKLTLGASGDGTKIDSVKVSGDVLSEDKLTKRNATPTSAAYVEITPENIYGTTTVKTTMTINYKEVGDKTTKRLSVKLEISPVEVEARDWETITNGVVYSFTDTDDVEFDFDYGRYEARITSGQKDVNLSYVSVLTAQLIEEVPDIIDAISFKGKHRFSLPGYLKFDGKYNDTKVYVYALENGNLTLLNYDAKEDVYVQRTQVLGTYVITDKEIKVPEVSEPIPEPTPVAPEKAPSNVNDNPNTGR